MRKLFLLPFLLFAQLTAVFAADVTYPVDYTSKITAPNFSNAAAGVAEASSNLDDTGWVNSSTLGGWMFSNFCADHTCWNADIWTGAAGVLDVHQNIKGLPDGFYRISCLATTKHLGGKQRAYVTTSARTAYSDTLKEAKFGDDKTKTYGAECWDSLTTERILVTDGNLTIGFTSTHEACTPNNSIGDFWCTHYHLYYYGPATDADMKDVLQNQFAALITKLGVFETDSVIASYPGISSTIDDYITSSDEVDTSSVDALKAAIQKAQDLMTNAKQGAADAQALAALVTKCTGVVTSTSYPGLDDFTTALVAAKNVVNNKDTSKASDYTSQLATLTAALKTYYLSQTADKDTPADYTFYISSPNFSKAAPGEAESNANKDATGWVRGSTYTGGWQYLNYCAGHTCWNADLWSGNEIYMDIHQNLTSLPQGYYAVSCLGLTKHLSNTQHAFATSTSSTVYSPVLTEAKFGDDKTKTYGVECWDSLTTEKILVTDGNLKIGFCSTREATSDQSVWSNSDFWCTHFHLYYYGAASTDEIKAMLNSKVTAAQAMADTMHFAVDKKALTDSIAIASSATTLDQINAAMITLKNGVNNATKSEKKYSSIMASGKAIPTMRDSLAKSTTAYGAGNALVAFTYNEAKKYIEAATTSYTNVDPMVNKVNKYFNTYYPVFKTAMDSVAIFKSEKAKSILSTIANGQSAYLTADTLKSTAIVDSLTKVLMNEFAICNGQDIYEKNKNATDFTFMIKNPDAGGSVNNTTGWEGRSWNNTDKGQHYLNDKNLRYFNAWNGKTGALSFYAYQVVNGLPNGTYTMKAACRTSGDKGTFIFASNGGTAKTDTTWVRVPLQTYTNAETGETSNADYQYGQIWQDATNAVTAPGGNYTDEQYAEAMANNNKGYGWEWLSVEGVVVNNHQIVIGMTTDSLKTGEAFNGTWVSFVDFSLTKTADGDNANWAGPIETSGINNATIDEKSITDGVFNLAGVKMNSNANLPKGIYIIKSGKQTRKVLVK